MRATYGTAKVNLASCAATAVGTPLPSSLMHPGTPINVQKDDPPQLLLTSSQPGVAAVSGMDIRAVRAGRATIVMEAGAFCSPPQPPKEGPQPKPCPLLSAAVDG